MKKMFGFLLLFSTLLGGSAYAIFPQDKINQNLLLKYNASTPVEGIGTLLNQTKNMMRVTYDIAVLAGTGTIPLVDDQGNAAYLPKGALVTNVVMNVLTQPLPSTSSVALQLLTAGDLMAEKAQSAVTGIVAGVPVGTAATWKGPVTAVNGTIPNVVLTGSTLTAGKIEWFIEYVIQ